MWAFFCKQSSLYGDKNPFLNEGTLKENLKIDIIDLSQKAISKKHISLKKVYGKKKKPSFCNCKSCGTLVKVAKKILLHSAIVKIISRSDQPGFSDRVEINVKV